MTWIGLAKLRVQALSSNADSTSSSGGLGGTSLFVLVAVVSGVTAIAALVIVVHRRSQQAPRRTEAVSSTHSVDHSEHRVFSNPLHHLVDDSSQSGTLTGKTAAGPFRQLIAESSMDSPSAGQTKPGHVYHSIDDTNTGIYLPAVRLPRTREESWDSTYWLVARKGLPWQPARPTLVGAQMYDLATAHAEVADAYDLATAHSAVAVQDRLPGSACVATDEDA